jgi:isopentenyldiphosphate isomerase
MMVYPPVVIVDEHDAVIGEAPLLEAWEKGLIHRVVFVILENDQGEVLLQHRSAHMRLFPGCWDISAGGHVDDGHSYIEAARIEIAEELGIGGRLDLEEVAYFYTDKPYPDQQVVRRFVKVYRAKLDELPHALEDHEVSEVRWFSIGALAELVSNPEKVASGLALVHEHVLRKDMLVVT